MESARFQRGQVAPFELLPATLAERSIPVVEDGAQSQGATRRGHNPADTAAYRADNEKRLAPVIKASGAKVE